MVGSPVMKRSCRIKVGMAMVKVEKATAKKVQDAKKLAKLAAMAKLGSTKKIPKTPKGEKEETFEPLNPKSGERGALTEKESSKGKASKDNVQVVEQFGSTFNSLESIKNEEENLEAVNISKKPMKALKWTKESKRAQEPLEAEATQEGQATK